MSDDTAKPVRLRRSRETSAHKWFVRGFATACAALARDHDQPSFASDLCRRAGIAWSDLVAAGCDPIELDALRVEMGPKEKAIVPPSPAAPDRG